MARPVLTGNTVTVPSFRAGVNRVNRLASAGHEDFQRSRPTHSEDVLCLGLSDVSRESEEEGQDTRRIAPGHPMADRL